MFGLLREASEAIEREFGGELAWFSKEGNKNCRVYVHKGIAPENREEWPDHHRWLQENLEKIARVCVPRIETMNLSDWVLESAE